MSETQLLGLPLLEAAQAQKHVTHNEALLKLDAAVHLAVAARSLAVPPAAAPDGARYLVPSGATGDWLGHDGEVAVRQSGAWAYMAARAGWRLWVEDEERLLAFTGLAWKDAAAVSSLQNAAWVGVNASADPGNRLAVSSPGVLLTHDGGDLRVKLNKQAAGDTGTLLYQTGYSGRAEIGLAGDDDLHVKVSPDGGTWTEAMVIDGATGAVAFPATPGLAVTDAERARLGGAADRAALALLPPAAGHVFLTEAGRAGWFRWDASNLSARVSADTRQAVYIAPSSASTGAAGAWVRVFEAGLRAEWFGVIADGTADDSAALQAGINLACALDVPLLLPEGTIRAAGLTTASKLHLKGVGPASIIKAAATMADGVALIGNANTGAYTDTDITFERLTLDGADLGRAGATQTRSGALCKFVRVTGLRFIDVTGRGYGHNLISMASCRNVRVIRGEYTAVGYTGASTMAGYCFWNNQNSSDLSTDVVFDGCHFHDNEWSAILLGGAGHTVTNCHFRNNKETHVYCANDNASASLVARDIRIVGNHFSGLRLKDISGNGLELGMFGGLVANNVVEDCDHHGIILVNAKHAGVFNNVVRNVAKLGIAAASCVSVNANLAAPNETSHIIISGNHLYDDQAVITSKRAMKIATTTSVLPHYLFIHGNNCAGTAWADAANPVIWAQTWEASTCEARNNPGALDLLSTLPMVYGQIDRNALLAGLDLVNAVDNGTFELGDYGFTKGAGWSVVSDAANAQSGNWIARNTSASGIASTLLSNGYGACLPGEVIHAEARFKTDAGAAMTTNQLTVLFYDRDKGLITGIGGPNETAEQTAYAVTSVAAAAPAGACYFRVRMAVAKTAGTLYLDSLFAARKRDAGQVLKDATVTAAQIAPGAVSNARLAPTASGTIKGRATAGSGNPEDLTAAQATAMLDLFNASSRGLVPAPVVASGHYLRDDGSWSAPAGGGDVSGPASSADRALARFSGGGGKLIQSSAVLLNDDGSLRLPSVAAPAAAAADTLNLMSLDVAGREMLAARAAGTAMVAQPLLARNKLAFWSPPGSGTALPGIFGLAAPTAQGTATTRAVSTGNALTRMRRLGYVSAATAGSLAGHYAPAAQFTIGDGGTLGGFLAIFRFGVSDAAAVAGARMFIGLRNAVAAPANTEPNSLTNAVGLAQLSTSNNLHIVYGGSAAQAAIDLGAGFPANTLSADAYELALHAPSGSQVINYRVERLGTGDTASGTLGGAVGTAVPAAATLLGHTLWRCNNATALAVGLDVTSIYIETDL